MWRRFYAFGLFSSLFLDQFLWLFYLLHLGYAAWQMGVSYALMQAGRMVFDVPSSFAADRLGARGMLVAGGLAKAMSSLCYLEAGRGFGYVAVGSVLTSLALTLPSGVDVAYLRGLTERTSSPDEHAFSKRLAGYFAMQQAAALAAGLGGGLIADVSFTLLYVLDALGGLLASLVAITLPRLPPVAMAEGSRTTQSPWAAIRAFVTTSRRYWRFGLLVAPLWALSQVGTEYTQALFRGLGLTPALTSVLLGAASALAWLTSWAVGRVPQHRQRGLLRLLLWGYPLSALLRAVPGRAALAFGIPGLCVGRAGSGAAIVLTSAELVRRAPAELRATALSAVDTVYVGLTIALFPLLGLLGAGRMDVAFLILGCGLLCIVPALQRSLTKDPGPAPEAAESEAGPR